MDGSRSMVIVSAHAADFVWRAGGAIALHTEAGGSATVVSLSYGENGESGDLWRVPGQTVEAVKEHRHAEASSAASALGAEFIPLDLGDYPLEVPTESLRQLASIYVENKTDVLLVHAPEDPFNPDHPVASEAAQKAGLLAMGAGGVPASFETIPPPVTYAFEPHQPDLCSFKPDTFVDVTSIWPIKKAAMEQMAAQSYLQAHYQTRAEQRAFQARYVGFGSEVTHVEAFQRLVPERKERL